MRYWTSKNSHVLQETPLHPQKVIAWCGCPAAGVIGPSMEMIAMFSICCVILSLCYVVQCADEEGTNMAKDTTQAQSAIYKIKRLDDSNDKLSVKQQKPQKQKQQQQLLLGRDMPSKIAATKPSRTKKLNKLAKNSHGMNKKLLNKLGFTKVKAPNSHNRKRLAIESRRHASPDDSHMFIIKLPPNVYYYSSPKAGSATSAAATANSVGGGGGGVAIEAYPKNALYDQSETEVLNVNGKKVPSFPFSSNGKPAKIYHWNLPIIKKILDDNKQRFPAIATAAATKDQLIDIKDIPTWNKPWENETIEKSYGKSSYKKSLKRKSPSYYAPANAVNKNSFNKYFSGNGKPKGFYVIKENQKKPLYYKNIIS